MGWFDFETDNFPVVLLLAISAFREEKDGFSTPPRQNKRRILQINGIKQCDRNIKCICGDLAFQILKIAWFVAGPPMAVAAAFTWRTYRKFRIFFVS